VNVDADSQNSTQRRARRRKRLSAAQADRPRPRAHCACRTKCEYSRPSGPPSRPHGEREVACRFGFFPHLTTLASYASASSRPAASPSPTSIATATHSQLASLSLSRRAEGWRSVLSGPLSAIEKRSAASQSSAAPGIQHDGPTRQPGTRSSSHDDSCSRRSPRHHVVAPPARQYSFPGNMPRSSSGRLIRRRELLSSDVSSKYVSSVSPVASPICAWSACPHGAAFVRSRGAKLAPRGLQLAGKRCWKLAGRVQRNLGGDAMVSGAAALLLQREPNSARRVKRLLVATARSTRTGMPLLT